MNVIRVGSVELAANANLFKCVDLAIDLSEASAEEVEVLADGVKVRGFTRGKSSYPPRREPLHSLRLAELEAAAIDRALEETSGNIDQAARILGIGKTTLYQRLKQRGKSVLVLQHAA